MPYKTSKGQQKGKTAISTAISIQHTYFSPRNKCLRNLASYKFLLRRRLQYLLFAIWNKYFIPQLTENTFISHWKKVKTGISDLRVNLNSEFQSHTDFSKYVHEID